MVDYKRQVNIRLTEDEHRRLKAAVALKGETLQDAGRRVLLQYIADAEQEREAVG